MIKHESRIKEYLNIYVIVAYVMFFISTLLTVFAYKGMELVTGAILGTLSYILIAILSRIFFNEKVGKMKLIGLLLIIGGIMVNALL